MAGKPREDRSSVASKHLGLRLTDDEFQLLRAVVDATNERMREAGLPPLMTGTSLVKMLVEQEARRLGVLPERGRVEGDAMHQRDVEREMTSAHRLVYPSTEGRGGPARRKELVAAERVDPAFTGKSKGKRRTGSRGRPRSPSR